MMTINKYLFCLALAAGSAMAQEGTTSLMECAGCGSAADVRALIAAGADVNARDHVGRTVLDYARTAGVFAYLRVQGAHSGKN
jgi:ankyrin repeat protein